MSRPSRYEAARDLHAACLREEALAARRASHAARQRPPPLTVATVAKRLALVAIGVVALKHAWPHLVAAAPIVAGWIP